MSAPTVKDIVAAALRAQGYDGLFSDDWLCACEIEDLAPCGEIGLDCTAGKKRILTQADCDSGRYDGCERAHAGDWIMEVDDDH